jgi:pimeloyl-ACP methyl ester carboxylesterase
MRGFLLFLFCLLSTAARADCPPGSRIADWVFGGKLCQAVTTFGAETAGASPVLIVVVHGDISDGGRVTYHGAFAQTLAQPGRVVVALTRPGYTDERGRSSEGLTHRRRDNYTRDNIAAVGGAIAALRSAYQPRRVIYLGHSGGAAIGGVLIARMPRLIDAAVLVSCPCDIARWLAARKQPPWPASLSPLDHAGRVPRETRVAVVAGGSDTNTFPAQAEGYARTLVRRGVDARFVQVDGGGHGLSMLGAAATQAVEEFAR